MDNFAITNRLPITPPVKEVRSRPSDDPSHQSGQQKYQPRKQASDDSDEDTGPAAGDPHNVDELA